jgi:hypothetical protein
MPVPPRQKFWNDFGIVYTGIILELLFLNSTITWRRIGLYGIIPRTAILERQGYNTKFTTLQKYKMFVIAFCILLLGKIQNVRWASF